MSKNSTKLTGFLFATLLLSSINAQALQEAHTIGPLPDQNPIVELEDCLPELQQNIANEIERGMSYIDKHKREPDLDSLDGCLSGVMIPTLNIPIFGGGWSLPSIDSLIGAACDMMTNKINEQIEELNSAIKDQTGGFFTIIPGDEPTWGQDLFNIDIGIPGFEDYEELRIKGGFGNVGSRSVSSVNKPMQKIFSEGVEFVNEGADEARGVAQEIDRDINDASGNLANSINESLNNIFGN